MKKVAILEFPGVALFELGCAVELFALARPEPTDWYQADVVSFERGELASAVRVSVNAKSIDSLADYTMLVIPS